MAKPVVVIPGYYGSKLADAVHQRVIWLNGNGLLNPDATLEALRLDGGDPQRVVPVGILDEVPILAFWSPDVYKDLLAFLRNNLHREHVFGFFYDWRKSLEEGADLLNNQILRLLEETGAPRVDLVAHSFGGLIARALFAKFPETVQKVDWLITLGTPHHGMLRTFRAVVEGLRAFAVFSPSRIREVSRTFPSAYDLLPNDTATGFFRFNGSPADPMQVNDWCETQDMRLLLAAAAGRMALLPRHLPVKTCMISGTRTSTTTSASFSGGATTFSDDHRGDGTVPAASASGQGLTGAEEILRFAVPFAPHANLFGVEKVQQRILTTVLVGRPMPEFHLFAGFASEPFFIPRQANLFAAAVFRKNGTPVTNARVRLTIDGTSVRNREIPFTTDQDYAARIVMPGPGGGHPWRVTAEIPGQPDPLTDRGLLVSTRS